MSGDEAFVLIISVVVSLFIWGSWISVCFSIENFGRGDYLRSLAVFAPGAAMCGLALVLRLYASHDVRDSLDYTFFYLAMGGAWLGLMLWLSGLCGLSFRDDWLERRNPSAAATGTGALLGGMAAFAGGNIGDGPGWWVVVFCALLSTVTLLAAWWLYDRLSGAMEQVIVERHLPAGLRLGAFLLLAGIITGRSVAGDWHDTGATLADFARQAWPLLPYTVGVALVEASQGRQPRGATLVYSVGWAWTHVGIAVLYLYWAGPWN